ncbi:MAG: hypothetical protein J4F28_01520 [Nitrosopumilaceae archaeon]|nr:hypothetical protein [Nitrosopumilaceae archaeon]
MKFLLVGGGGREASFALNLAGAATKPAGAAEIQSSSGDGSSRDAPLVYAVMPHENPLIADCTRRSGGDYTIGNPSDPDTVLEYARLHSVDYAFVNADEPLANGVVDALVREGFKAVGGTKSATRIEWDKVYAMEMMSRLCPEYTPLYRVVRDERQLGDAISEFESRGMHLVVKPQGLTGGKGVKVMPEHLASYEECARYASELLGAHGGRQQVLLVEKLDGLEFTIMGLTDGTHLVMSPATYDYPYRLEGDRGPGTGGMGCFSDCDTLPFLSDSDLEGCQTIMRRVIDDMRARGLGFTGVLNGGFFKTAGGIRFMEFNSRFGDPECLNIMSVLETPLSEVLARMWEGTLSGDTVSFANKASVCKYLVAREYPSASPSASCFEVDDDSVGRLGVTAYYASCVRADAAVDGDGCRLRTWDSRSQVHEPVDPNFRQALDKLNRLKDKMAISDTVIEKAAYVYRKALDKGLARGRSTSALVASALYAACRETATPRNLKDVEQATNIKRKDIARCYRLLVRELDPDDSNRGVDAHDHTSDDVTSDTGSGHTYNKYRTLKRSRVVAFCAASDTVQGASDKVNEAIDSCVRTGVLEYRRDIGSAQSLGAMDTRAKELGASQT